MSDKNIRSVTPGMLSDTLQKMGYRTEVVEDQLGAKLLRSATNGLGFTVSFGNRADGEESTYLDVTFVLVLQVEGALPSEIVNLWNATKRFSRLHGSPNALVLEMDVSLVGGVSVDHLLTKINIWDRLVQELLHFLRTELARRAAADEGAKAGAGAGEGAKQVA